MGQQIIVEGAELMSVSHALDDAGLGCDVFPLADGRVGVSIPTKVIDAFGERHVADVLSAFTYIDLWSGERLPGRGRGC